MATFLPPSSMESLSILAFAVAVLDSSDESSSTLKEPPPGREWSFDGSVKETSWLSSRVSIVGAWYQSLLFAPMKMVSIRVLGLPFQPEDVVRDRAGTTAAQSFRCLSDEQNMAAHRLRFDNAAFSGSRSNRRILVSFIGLQGTGMACNRSHVWTCKSVQLVGGQSIRTELHEQPGTCYQRCQQPRHQVPQGTCLLYLSARRSGATLLLPKRIFNSFSN